MTGSRVHITDSSGDPAPRRTTPEQSGYVSPAVQRHTEMLAAIEADAARDRYQPPTTLAELLAMRSEEQVRTYNEHRDRYDAIMQGETVPLPPTTREDLLALPHAEAIRLRETDPAAYDRLMSGQ
ncbi:hypothetical protein ABZ669_06825 [Streptomyces hirsutus]|uniref:hypothetical protein n=1 Tax=Streptomyces hirsutus TaxID=35620 RepID=UPI0034101F89